MAPASSGETVVSSVPSNRRRLTFFSRKSTDERLDWVAAVPFFGLHLLAVVGLFYFGFSWKGFGLAIALYYFRMFGVTGGYHRYFSHKTFETSRVFQFLLAFFAMTSTQKGVLWWASHHRIHHKRSDKPDDVHSRKQHGFIWSHLGWIVSHRHDETEWSEIQDLAKYPELRFINKHHHLPTVLYVIVLYLAGGPFAVFWGFCVSTTLLWHGTFTINSLAHWLGRRRYDTTDESKNSLLLALVALGEGWHNNHHYYPKACNQGFYWWEIDITYYVIRTLEALRIVWNVETPPKAIRDRRMVRRKVESTPDTLQGEPVAAE
ncbi:MAG: acyl-CoA desaturase [Polyangiaceae bacterium]|nr:acyl-CoA desaturase [Polyangiaceae bacterium]